jgi:5S rRNA maturation endonuclease (ribonuclease M5)
MDEALETFLEALHESDDGETVFIVEGKRDVAALKGAGVRSVMEIDTNLYLFCERVAKKWKKACILTDLDAEGKRLYGKVKGYLVRNGVRIDEKPRELLFKTELRQVEGLGRHPAS